MSLFWYLIFGYFGVSILIINGWWLVARLLPARNPILWEKHFVAPDPNEK
jgi:hypothetical protein